MYGIPTHYSAMPSRDCPLCLGDTQDIAFIEIDLDELLESEWPGDPAEFVDKMEEGQGKELEGLCQIMLHNMETSTHSCDVSFKNLSTMRLLYRKIVKVNECTDELYRFVCDCVSSVDSAVCLLDREEEEDWMAMDMMSRPEQFMRYEMEHDEYYEGKDVYLHLAERGRHLIESRTPVNAECTVHSTLHLLHTAWRPLNNLMHNKIARIDVFYAKVANLQFTDYNRLRINDRRG